MKVKQTQAGVKTVNKRIGTLPQTSQAYPAFTVASLRWLVFNEKTNGFSSCIRRIGRKVLIDFDSFEQWIDDQQLAA
ncbi:MAG: hypothetical protein ACI89S_001143 [Gammaproteobacteria bacterium]|jgi:hypothetical protein